MKTLGNSDNTFIWLWMNLCDVALDAFLWFDEFIAPCYLLQLSYCGCFLSWYHIPISLITPTESLHPPPNIHTWPLLTPLRTVSSDSPQAKKHSISSPAFHLKNNLRSAFDQWSGAFSCLPSSRHEAAFICQGQQQAARDPTERAPLLHPCSSEGRCPLRWSS